MLIEGKSHLKLTSKGRKLFASLNARSNSEISGMLSQAVRHPTKSPDRGDVCYRRSPNPGNVFQVPYIIRQHQPGDMGWISTGMVCCIPPNMAGGRDLKLLLPRSPPVSQNYQPETERCWIAERRGEIVGSVMLVKLTDTTAKLRLLLVEPNARGLGIGKRLVAECIRFARHAGYSKINALDQQCAYCSENVLRTSWF